MVSHGSSEIEASSQKTVEQALFSEIGHSSSAQSVDPDTPQQSQSKILHNSPTPTENVSESVDVPDIFSEPPPESRAGQATSATALPVPAPVHPADDNQAPQEDFIPQKLSWDHIVALQPSEHD
ncbi:hypothetical protein ACOMHN_059380 [Nucella lapillus]